MLAETVQRSFERFCCDGLVDLCQPFTLFELGAGNGDLARDTSDYVTHRLKNNDARWQRLAPRLRYVIGEHRDRLRERQAAAIANYIAADRAEVRAVDALNLEGAGRRPFDTVL